jgi:PAS domain S-box-containing protein
LDRPRFPRENRDLSESGPPSPDRPEPEDLALWDSLFRNSYDIVLVTDPAGRMLYINRTLPSIRPEDVLGTYPEDYFRSPFREKIREAIDRVRQTLRPRRIEAEFTGPDGAEYCFEAKIAPLLKEDRVAHLLFHYNDVTHKRSMEAQLRRGEEQMRLALENLPVLVNALGPDLRILFWNRECERTTGYAAAEVVGNPDIWEAFYPDPEIRDRLFRHLRTVRDIRESEWEIRCRDGTRRIVAWSSYGGSCSIPGWANWSVGIDMTARRAAEAREREHEARIRHADRLAALGTIVSGVAHEINNPNHFILMNAQGLHNAWKSVLPILAEYAEDHPELRVGAFDFRELRDQVNRAFANIRESSDRITAIVRELKEYSRPTVRGTDRIVELETVISRAVRILEFMRETAPFRFSVHIGETAPVRGDSRQLEQVVVNLLQNAFFAMNDRSGSVQLDAVVGEDPETVEIRVRDEGVGIPEADLERIFDPFFTTRRAEGGTGLGLAVSERIVRDHGGCIRFESRPGEGTLARVILPVAPEDPTEAEPD